MSCISAPKKSNLLYHNLNELFASCTRRVDFRKTPIRTRLVMNATNQIIFIAWPRFLNCQKIYKDKEASSRKEKERLLEEIVLRNHEYTIIFLIEWHVKSPRTLYIGLSILYTVNYNSSGFAYYSL